MDVAKVLSAAVDQLSAAGGKVVLVLDQPDLWLAAAGPGDGVTNGSLKDLVLDLREVGSTRCLSRPALVSSSLPLPPPPLPPTPGGPYGTC